VLGETDAHDFSAGQFDPARSLDLQEEEINRVVHPENFTTAHCGFAALDFCARVIRHDLVSLQTAAQPHAFEIRLGIREVDDQQIVRNTIQRKTIRLARYAAAAQQWLKISGDQTFRASVGIVDGIRNEAGLEELPHCRRIFPRDLCRGGKPIATRVGISGRRTRAVAPAIPRQDCRLPSRATRSSRWLEKFAGEMAVAELVREPVRVRER
jgi:hypothetical protein